MSNENDHLILNDSSNASIDTTCSVDTYSLPQIDLSSLSNSMIYNVGASGSGTYNWTTSSPSYGNITINSSNTGYNGAWVTSSGSKGLHVSSDAEFEGDIKWKGRSLGKLLEKIEDRLAILTPDSKKLEHFAALKKAYDHYKALEALCEIPKEEDDNT